MERVVRLSGARKRELWERWRRGETLAEIGRALGRSQPRVYSILKANADFKPHGAPQTSASQPAFLRSALALRPWVRADGAIALNSIKQAAKASLRCSELAGGFGSTYRSAPAAKDSE